MIDDLHLIGRVGDVPLLEGRSVTVAGRRVAVFRTDEGHHAIDATCPHRGGPLADGLVADACVTCPLHGWRFDLRSGAALGSHPGVAVHEVLERDGELWLRLAPAPELAQAA
ncbi:MAG TPA: Rieske 2Fe-2S domain-containing protein [Conexibacter sp.]|nr:Rieske 2Fe-2S domain-containing protein [Conexibacter sp.]